MTAFFANIPDVCCENDVANVILCSSLPLSAAQFCAEHNVQFNCAQGWSFLSSGILLDSAQVEMSVFASLSIVVG